MDIDDGGAAIQFLHHGIEAGISEPPIAITRHEHDAVGVELVERVFDLTQAAFNVGQRKCSANPIPSASAAVSPKSLFILINAPQCVFLTALPLQELRRGREAE